jgi:hypothetical protein
MAPKRTVNPELKSFVSTQLLFTRMDDAAAADALEFLGAADSDGDTAVVVFSEPVELVGV